jgi:hypothetical protein
LASEVGDGLPVGLSAGGGVAGETEVAGDGTSDCEGVQAVVKTRQATSPRPVPSQREIVIITVLKFIEDGRKLQYTGQFRTAILVQDIHTICIENCWNKGFPSCPVF